MSPMFDVTVAACTLEPKFLVGRKAPLSQTHRIKHRSCYEIQCITALSYCNTSHPGRPGRVNSNFFAHFVLIENAVAQ